MKPINIDFNYSILNSKNTSGLVSFNTHVHEVLMSVRCMNINLATRAMHLTIIQ